MKRITTNQFALCYGDEEHKVEIVSGTEEEITSYLNSLKAQTWKGGCKEIDHYIKKRFTTQSPTIIFFNYNNEVFAVTSGSQLVNEIMEYCDFSQNEHEDVNINTEAECIDHLLQMSCDYFTETMRKIGALGKDDYVTEYSSEAIADAVVGSNQAGYDVTLDLQLLHDEFIYVRYEGEHPNKVCKINGIMDSREDWCDWFNLKEVVKNHAEEIMNTGYSNE